MTVMKLAGGLRDAMIADGYTPRTAWTEYETGLLPIALLHEKHECNELNEDILAEFCRQVDEKQNANKIVYSTARRLKGAAERLLYFHRTGEIKLPRHPRKSNLNPYYESIVNDFLSNVNDDWGWGERAMDSAKSDLNQHFFWLMQNGCHRLEDVDADTIRRYIVHCSEKYQALTLSFIKCRLRKIYRFWFETGRLSNDFTDIFSFPSRYPRKIIPAPSQADIAKVMSQIDRSRPKGKRDYAMILLATVTGLRRCDIVRLKLTDIDWQKGEIRIVQHKTNKPIALPLTGDAGKALKDYILNGRTSPSRQVPKEYDEIFLTVNHPCHPLVKGEAITAAYANYAEKADVKSSGFHGLRRALGRDMVAAEVPLPIVAQVFDHDDVDTTKVYVSLESKHLAECAMDFGAIAPKGRLANE